jgi:hypothetical protein
MGGDTLDCGGGGGTNLDNWRETLVLYIILSLYPGGSSLFTVQCSYGDNQREGLGLNHSLWDWQVTSR